MEPSIKSGDIIIIQNTKESDLKNGDVITFSKNEKVITHRIIKIEKESENILFTTKGDNNNIEDEEKISSSDIKGRCVFTIPFVGKIIKAMGNKIIFLIFLLVLLILCFFKINRDEKREIRSEKKKHEEEK